MQKNQTGLRGFWGTCSMVVAVLVGSLTPALADEKILGDFIGSWQSDDSAFGRVARSTLSWTPTLDGKFVRLQYAIRTKEPANEKPFFSGIAYYKQMDTKFLSAFWADSIGDLHPIRATLTDKTLVAIWGKAGEKQGRTQYQIHDTGQMTVTDWILGDDGWRQFNQINFTRDKPVTENPMGEDMK